MEKLTDSMTIAEILKKKPDAARILMKHGMHCLGCAVASAESLKEAAQVHGIDLAKLMEELNQ